MKVRKPKITLKSLRGLRNISQKSLGLAIGRSESTIINWENGKSTMGIPDYFKIKEELDPADEFFLEVKSS